jgi:hypothetical protein
MGPTTRVVKAVAVATELAELDRLLRDVSLTMTRKFALPAVVAAAQRSGRRSAAAARARVDQGFEPLPETTRASAPD